MLVGMVCLLAIISFVGGFAIALWVTTPENAVGEHLRALEEYAVTRDRYLRKQLSAVNGTMEGKK